MEVMPNPPLTSPASRRVTVGAVLAFLLAVVAALVPAAPAHAAEADSLHSLVNSSRAAAGLAPLTRNAAMDAVAAAWAAQLAAAGALSHNPAYSSQIPGGWVRAAENVAQGQPTAAAMHDAWMASSGHRANVLGDFTDIGIAFLTAGGTTWGVEVFAAYPGSAPAEPAPAPAPAPAAPAPAPSAPPAGSGSSARPAPGGLGGGAATDAGSAPEDAAASPEDSDTGDATAEDAELSELRVAPSRGTGTSSGVREGVGAAAASATSPGGWMWVPFAGATLLAGGGATALLLRRRGLIGPPGGRHTAER